MATSLHQSQPKWPTLVWSLLALNRAHVFVACKSPPRVQQQVDVLQLQQYRLEWERESERKTSRGESKHSRSQHPIRRSWEIHHSLLRWSASRGRDWEQSSIKDERREWKRRSLAALSFFLQITGFKKGGNLSDQACNLKNQKRGKRIRILLLILMASFF